MMQLQIPLSDAMYQRLQQLAQQQGQPIEVVAQAMLNASINVAPPDPYPLEASLAILHQISGSLSIPHLDVNQHDRYVAGLEEEDAP